MRLACLLRASDELPADAEHLLTDLNNALELIERINTIDTKNVQPLSHPLDISQPLRVDQPNKSIDTDALQKGAPQLRDGFYLVPKVIETDTTS